MTPPLTTALMGGAAPPAPPLWSIAHQGLVVWVGLLAGVLVVLSLPFLLRWLSEVARRRRTAAEAISAARHARYALQLIAARQEELAAILRNPANATQRRWAFEFQVAAGALTNALSLDIGCPCLQRHMIAAQTWSEMAADDAALEPAAALAQLQRTEGPRAAVDADLQKQLFHFMLILGAPVLPKPTFRHFRLRLAERASRRARLAARRADRRRPSSSPVLSRGPQTVFRLPES